MRCSLSDLSRLDRPAATRIIAKLDKAAADPQHYFERLVSRDDYKLRTGDYRILTLLRHSTKTIIVQEIGHKKNVYK